MRRDLISYLATIAAFLALLEEPLASFLVTKGRKGVQQDLVLVCCVGKARQAGLDIQKVIAGG